MKFDSETYKFTESGKLGNIALAIGLVSLAASAYGFAVDRGQWYYSYLTAFMFWLSIGLGGLFFTLLHYLTNARWSLVIRRLSETSMITLPFMAVMFIPILFGMHDLYHWTHYDAVMADSILVKKVAYLNIPFFLVRSAAYFAIWSFLAIYLYKKSSRQDEENPEQWLKSVRVVAAPGMILFAGTITFAAFDWMMSLDPHWYSTIYGVYYFAGSFLSFLCFTVLCGRYLGSRGILKNIITVEHYHDLGKLIFAFIVFWTYMAYSQYFLIWYANIPEETVWFLKRWEGSWKEFSLLLIFGHFAIPFLGLLTQGAKRNAIALSVAAVWILLMRWVDLYWLIFPEHSRDGVHLSWIDFATMLGIGGLFVWFFWKRLTSRALIPVSDPYLKSSLSHTS